MPELPEVETIARGLDRTIRGKTFAHAEVLRASVVATPDGRPLGASLAGETVTGVGRRGKLVRIGLASGRELVVHLRMTGRLIVQAPAPGDPERIAYANVVLSFADGTRLSFADVRRFGRMRLVESEDPWAAGFGCEPLSDDFTLECFSRLLAGRSTPIKTLLLDQRRIAGIGNIYACEALWRARIRPDAAAGRLSAPARRRLHDALREILARAIEMRGTSVDDYVDAEGLRGGFQNVLSVYGKAGRPCSRCNRALVRTVIAQRGTFWCRTCQRR